MNLKTLSDSPCDESHFCIFGANERFLVLRSNFFLRGKSLDESNLKPPNPNDGCGKQHP
jgi:hypothetical protein